MNYKSVTIISIIVTAIFVMPLFSFAADETVLGTPFQALQEQIDDLQQQINDLQQGCIPAAYSTNANLTVLTEEPVIVMQIPLPKGNYVSNISLGAKYGNTGFDSGCWAYLNCQIVDGVTHSPIAGGVGGNVVGIMTHSSTEILTLNEDTTVALECSEESPLCWYDTNIEVSGSWTFIEVEAQ